MKRSRRVAWLAAVVLALLPAPVQAQGTLPEGRDVTATLFQWSFDSVARACTDDIGPAGYGAVEVSPAHEHIAGPQWWTVYQPVSYRIAGRLGNERSFRRMVRTCHDAGVRVVADAVINHMTAGADTGTGTGGSPYAKYDYPGWYREADFHSCRTGIDDYSDRHQVQECELVGLADLDTGSDGVRATIATYLDGLVALGVDGFRIDAAKHIAAADLAAIKARLRHRSVYWVQEVGVDPDPAARPAEAVQPAEYTEIGDVDEFGAAYDLARIFTGGGLSELRHWGDPARGYLPSAQARTFVDNWDTERAGSTLNVGDGTTYTLANVFLLAWPYGAPNVYSGYEFSDRDAGPPRGGTVRACFRDGWTCHHARARITAMVGFRNAVSGTPVTDWWDNGGGAVAFGRGEKGFVAINHEAGPLTQTFTTSLPAGTYCDLQHGRRRRHGRCTGPAYAVDTGGRFTATVGAGDALALLRRD
jgi:alpha-amylase